ncbi:diguanylate cyclase [Shewanella salipaludis]|uniref:diguanylate cyclase n=1 Tax=Shewanella salipaludis TaxID=2723052 RepID=A0A972FUD6_9GAMM|nr:diguanylate cyclase [Shewanella salipaludis]NMH66340.1 diguanylate cyclase [Shewanella salipaludis]
MENSLNTQTDKPCVLVVDDNVDNLDVMIANLQQESIELLVSLSGEEGLQLARELSPDLILLDIMMPGMDGFEVCRRLKQDQATADIPVIFISAKNNEADIEQGLRLGAIDFVNKPFSIPILKARLRNHLEVKNRTDRLARLACTDALTGIANRRHFDCMLEREWRRAAASQYPLSALMIDIDYFKQFNDSYGHNHGDECIRQTALTLGQQLLRPADLLARYGGEEFVVLLPETSETGALAVAERLRQAMEAQAIPHAGSACLPHVSVSIGIASMYPRQGDNWQTLLHRADQGLYLAKQQGRNRVCSLDETSAQIRLRLN